MSLTATSLFEANPALARGIDHDVAHLRILPLLPVGDGAAVPADPGAGVIALVVLGGLLVSDSGTLAGPGDVIAGPASGWTGCTDTQLAIVGPGFAEVAGAQPAAAAG